MLGFVAQEKLSQKKKKLKKDKKKNWVNISGG